MVGTKYKLIESTTLPLFDENEITYKLYVKEIGIFNLDENNQAEVNIYVRTPDKDYTILTLTVEQNTLIQKNIQLVIDSASNIVVESSTDINIYLTYLIDTGINLS